MIKQLVDELSIGFQTVKNGTRTERRDSGSTLYEHHRARLMEISLVPWGAYGREATLSRSRLIDPSTEMLQARRAEVRRRVAELAAHR